MWGLIGFGLLILFSYVGYHAVLRIRSLSPATNSSDVADSFPGSVSRAPDSGSVAQVETPAVSAARDNPIAVSPEHRERIMRLLANLQKRAEEDRRNLPQLEADAALSKSGDLDVRLGELYFGFGNFERAVTSIKRGLAKGSVTHLGVAYVYLGRSAVALGDFDGARSAFAELQSVSNISPGVARLWQLYADTLPGAN